MDGFKRALKAALKHGADQLIVEVGKAPTLLTDAKNLEIDMGKFEQSQISKYFEIFFSKDQKSVEDGERVKGVLSVEGVGDMRMIGYPKLQVKVFLPPNGESQFSKEWNDPGEGPKVFGSSKNDQDDISVTTSMIDSLVNKNDSAKPSLPSVPLEQGAIMGGDSSLVEPRSNPISDKQDSSSPDLSEMRNAFSMKSPQENIGDPNSSLGGGSNEGFDYGSILENTGDHGDVQDSLASGSNPSPQAFNSLGGVIDAKTSDIISGSDIFTKNLDDSVSGSSPVEESRALPLDSNLDNSGQSSEVSGSFRDKSSEVKNQFSNYNSEINDKSHGLDHSVNNDSDSNGPVFSMDQVAEEGGIGSVPASLESAESKEVLARSVASEREIFFGAHLPGATAPEGDFPINVVLDSMVKKGASDLHLMVGQPITLRIDGSIVRVDQKKLSAGELKNLILPIMPKVNRTEFLDTNDTDFAYQYSRGRFRVNVYRDRGGVGAVLRVIPSEVLSADTLGLSQPIRKFCQLSKGLVLVTGPTGSGKSTTLAAMVDLINSTRPDHILTIEDPIEFVHQQKLCRVTQREVHTHTKSFSRALRAALREDPDVVLIGEMRDLETISIALETAETGHLVLGTLHTTGAISTVDRIIDQFPEASQNQVRTMLASSLKGVVSQVLVKKKAGGRVAAHEIMVSSRSISSMIRDNKLHMIHNDLQTKKAEGNQLMSDALYDLIRRDIVTPEDAISKSAEPDEFMQLLKSRGITPAS